ncbi:PP2C family protein-serine/threonine phosphatase [Cellulomonas sp. S1-8]|uniref:PP2C family protein-serine/threonine phosphatase n=1 Tax=Cellulomonas sp. S1-8 TaxID=2904790 RepID=UPI002244155F|nr:PP2C family protein-serine/threonine phosphatase [Cellulomonas sp. S1-8]UZN04734.1 serine/threonine-protein phosphatase [Cellulomonas sp. S1-8]
MGSSPFGARGGWAWRLFAGWAAGPQARVVGVLVLLAALYSLGALWQPDWFALSGFVLLLLVGAFVLRWRYLVVLVVVVAALTVACVVVRPAAPTPGPLVVVGLACAAVLVFGRERDQLGLQGAPGALMLVDLRDRLAAGGRLPGLPLRWQVDAEVRSAHAAAFSGDFLVSHLRGTRFEVVLVDVSGKGQAAGVRALQLQGALGGLLGALRVEDFLPAANSYLLGQGWDEGFATAAHLSVDLATGAYRVGTAGHPPPAVLHAGSGRIELLDGGGGIALGVVEDMEPGVRRGALLPGDVIVLYTDGLVEAPGRDVDQGIDRLLGVIEEVLAANPGNAHEVLVGARVGDDDDRAVVVLRRS